MFNGVKNSIINIIKNNSKNEISYYTKFNTSGIYLIYLDDFSDNKILPIYIGQTKNFQNRYKQHYKEILALNRTSYDIYKAGFFSDNGEYSLYNGHFKSCKIFKYMLERNLKLKDWHMIVIDFCSKEELDLKEMFYINKYKSAFFGFNQLNSFTFLIKLQKEIPSLTNIPDNNVNYLLDLTNDDIKYISMFYSYGYTEFNYKYAFRKDKFPIKSISKKLQIAIKNINEDICNLNKSLNYTPVIIKTNKDYVSYYNPILNLIFPKVEYENYPLADNDYKYTSFINEVDKTKENYCYIYFYLSNNGKSNCAPSILKIDYIIVKNNNIIKSVNNFIKSPLSNLLYSKPILYFPKESFSWVLKYEPFNVVMYYKTPTGRLYFSNQNISLLSELKTGINDYTILNSTLVSFDKVINDISKNIDEYTKFKIFTSEAYSLLDIAIKELNPKTYNCELVQGIINKTINKNRKIDKNRVIKKLKKIKAI